MSRASVDALPLIHPVISPEFLVFFYDKLSGVRHLNGRGNHRFAGCQIFSQLERKPGGIRIAIVYTRHAEDIGRTQGIRIG
jgi:hypothetical protein